MPRTNSNALIACFSFVSLVFTGCTAPPPDGGGGNGGGGDGGGGGGGDVNTNGVNDGGGSGGGGMDGGTAQGKATPETASQGVLSVIIARNEDARSSGETLRVRGAGEVACPLGGTRSIGEDGLIQFNDCEFFPGVPMNGGVRVTPGAEGTQGGSIDFENLLVGPEDEQFMIDGMIGETENPDGSLTFTADARTTSSGDGDTDIFNLLGEITVGEDGTMMGNMNVTSGSENSVLENACDFTGVSIFAFEEDPSAIETACGFNEEDPDFAEQSCDCPEGQDCIPIEEEEGVFFDLCNNCETDQDCLDSGLGNECVFEFGCMMFECFSDADCDPGFECISTVSRGGDCEQM